MNSLVKAASQAVAVRTSDPLDAFVQATASSQIVGSVLRFSKGDWLVGSGEDSTEIPQGTRFVVSLDDGMIGWAKWVDKKLVDQVMVPLTCAGVMALRRELGDTDESQWPRDADGKPKDPWQKSLLVPMLGVSGELYTFTSGSQGGLQAAGRLGKVVVQNRSRHANDLPVVEIKTAAYVHDQFGRVKKPEFVVVDWAPRTKFNTAMAAAGYPVPAVEGPALAPSAPSRPPAPAMVRGDMNDDIPF